MATTKKLEKKACIPAPIKENGFNKKAVIPYGCTTEHIKEAMNDFINFLGVVNSRLNAKGIERLESFLMPANFSSIAGEFIGMSIPKYCLTINRNQYHNGHPDLVPDGEYPNNSVLRGDSGIEIKASRRNRGWQGHNPEDGWLLVFVFESNTPRDESLGIAPFPFKFTEVLGARLKKEDWNYSGRSLASRRTITASVNRKGYEKMQQNWIYKGNN